MLRDVTEAKAIGGYRIWLRFDDVVEGEIDLATHLAFKGVFALLRDESYFAQVQVDPELGTITWPNGADWDSLVLYSLVTGRSIEELLAETASAHP